MLVAIPGIGRKLAERVIFELKEKVAAAGIAAAGTVVAGAPGGDGDVVGALQALGYSLAEAREAARISLAGSKVGDSLEDRVKTALRALARD
jgi:Holliday junction DNA helicase RuvA